MCCRVLWEKQKKLIGTLPICAARRQEKIKIINITAIALLLLPFASASVTKISGSYEPASVMTDQVSKNIVSESNTNFIFFVHNDSQTTIYLDQNTIMCHLLMSSECGFETTREIYDKDGLKEYEICQSPYNFLILLTIKNRCNLALRYLIQFFSLFDYSLVKIITINLLYFLLKFLVHVSLCKFIELNEPKIILLKIKEA